MYEQYTHNVLNKILDEISKDVPQEGLRYFYSRLGANFYAIYGLFEQLYGDRSDFDDQIYNLVAVLAKRYIDRGEKLKAIDRQREADHNWFLSQKWVGMALYANGFAENLQGFKKRIGYFNDLGVNLVHILPILQCPEGKSDGGYAVSNFREVDRRIGSNQDIEEIVELMQNQDMLLVLDMVVNHTSEEHEWAERAKQGEAKYQEYYYTFENRDIPDMFEYGMLDIFPETDPGNFTFNDEMQKWVMTVFHNYQWDLNYTNPEVFIGMLDNILYWANKGVDIVRLDAVAFLWKKIGTTCQNENESHLILQLFKDCCQVVAPGLLFIAEAIVAPSELIKYFGEDAVVAKECDIAYNATFMALLWDSVATKNAALLSQGLKNFPDKLEGATWLNYLRCHDDIGFGFDDHDIAEAGYQPSSHRKFLLDYFTGNHPSSSAKGMLFGENKHTGDARISGSLASLIGLEAAIDEEDCAAVEKCCDHIIMLHSLIMSFGGIPLLYYGDEIGLPNDYSYQSDPHRNADSRWLHRSRIDWKQVERIRDPKTVESTIFGSLKKLISIRKATPAFADFNNRDYLELSNKNLFGFVRHNHISPGDKVIVVANMSPNGQQIPMSEVIASYRLRKDQFVDLWTNQPPHRISENLVFGGFQFYWLKIKY